MEFDKDEIEEELIGKETKEDIGELRKYMPMLTQNFNDIELFYIWKHYSGGLCASWITPKVVTFSDGDERYAEIKTVFDKFAFLLGKGEYAE